MDKRRHNEFECFVEQIVVNRDYTKLYEYKEFYLNKLYCIFKECYDSQVIKYVIDNSVDLEYKNYGNVRLIHYFCKNINRLEILKYLIQKGVDVNSISSCNYRPIHYICRFQNYDTIKWAIESKLFDLDLSIRTKDNLNWIDLLSEEIVQKLIEEEVIKIREYGYILSKLEEQTVEQCQDAIDCDPSNKKYIREDLLRYFN